MIPMKMDKLIYLILLMFLTLPPLLKNVIPITTELLMLVKSMLVSSEMKTTIEILTVPSWDTFIVNVHLILISVLDLGIVMILSMP